MSRWTEGLFMLETFDDWPYRIKVWNKQTSWQYMYWFYSIECLSRTIIKRTQAQSRFQALVEAKAQVLLLRLKGN